VKTNDSVRSFDNSGRVDTALGITRIGGGLIEKPLYFLFVIFLSYLLVDLVATLVMFGPIEEWFIPLYHFIAGYILIALYFRYVLPDFFIHGRKVRAVCFLLILLSGLVGTKLFIFQQVFGEPVNLKSFLLNEFLRIFHFLFLTSAIWVLYQNIGLRQKKYEMEMEHEGLKVAHRSLQLSPHFVLNALSHYSGRIAALSPDLLVEFSNLTSLLRYSFKEHGVPNSLKEEMDAVGHYLQCQKLRFSRLSLVKRIDLDPASLNLPMPRLCLLTLVENVFFHGIYEDRKNPCIFSFLLAPSVIGEGFTFTAHIFNPMTESGPNFRTGFGASSVFRVLKYNYGDRFHCFISSSGNEYSLFITIDYDTENKGRTD